MEITVRRATPADAPLVAEFALRLTEEVMERAGVPDFDADPQQAAALCRDFLERGLYTAFFALEGAKQQPIAAATLCESHALYARGSFGIIQEFFVEPAFRSQDVGAALLGAIVDYGRERGWTRVELCTPPLPEFSRTLGFYEKNGFKVTGGRKMKQLIDPL